MEKKKKNSIIDCNMHWMPETLFQDEAMMRAFIRMVPRGYGKFARIDKLPNSNKDQIIIEEPKGYENLNYYEENVDAEKRVAAMDEAGVDKAIFRMPCWQEWLDLEMAKKLNDMMHKTVMKYPARFMPVGLVPPWADKDCVYEMERCVKDLGCVGIQVPSHYGTLYLEEEEFRPFFKKMAQLDVPVIVHHTPLPVDHDHIYKYTNVRRVFGRIIDQLTCLAGITHCGLFDELPNLKMQFTFFGGGFFAFKDMIAVRKSAAKFKERIERNDTTMPEKIAKYLRNNLYFDMCHAPPWGKEVVAFAVKQYGADHVLYGSSYPLKLEWASSEAINFMKSLDLSEEEKNMVLGGTAVKLYKIKV
jgi:predicted TIM-barrel fold metal-dependent hydrolase